MAYLKPQTPLKDLNSGDYFYPLTTIDQIITGTSRLSAFLSESNNLLNLSNIGNLSVNNINVNSLTVSGNTTLNNGLTVSGNTTLNHGNFYFNSDTGTYKFYITRDGSATESTGIWVNDSYTFFDVTNDETTANVQFKLQATDTESGGGAGAQTSYVNFYGRKGKSTINANCFGVNGDNTDYNLYVNGTSYFTNQLKMQYNTPNLIIKNTNASGHGIIRLLNSDVDDGAIMFLNGPSRTDDGGVNMFTIRNNRGDIRLDDNTYITGTIHCSAGAGNYCEGMRFERPDGQWVTIALGGTATSGTNANCWSIHRKPDNNFCISRNSSDGANGLVMTQTGMGLGTTAPVSRLTVQGVGSDSVGTIRVIETRTDAGWHYPILCTSPNIANDGNIYLCLGKAASPGNAGGVRWYHAGDNSNDNFIGFEIYGVGTYLYTKRNTYSYATRLYGAVWNDYAEFRQTKNEIEPGRCIAEIGDDTLELTTKRLQAGCEIVSDTYGFAIGESEKCKTPTAASGRVLAYAYEDRNFLRQHIGEPVCSGPNGTVSLMTPEEEKEWPSRIIGTISAIPDYEVWHAGHNDENNVDIPIQVNGRIWIRIR